MSDARPKLCVHRRSFDPEHAYSTELDMVGLLGGPTNSGPCRRCFRRKACSVPRGMCRRLCNLYSSVLGPGDSRHCTAVEAALGSNNFYTRACERTPQPNTRYKKKIIPFLLWLFWWKPRFWRTPSSGTRVCLGTLPAADYISLSKLGGQLGWDQVRVGPGYQVGTR